jgi:hypothetical protein
VLTGLVGDPDVVTGLLRVTRSRGPAVDSHWGFRVLIGAVLAVLAVLGTSVVLLWLWTAWVAVAAWCVLLAADRIAALGHRVDSRAGDAGRQRERRRDCPATAGIIGWTVRCRHFSGGPGWPSGEATAAGVKRYPLIDAGRPGPAAPNTAGPEPPSGRSRAGPTSTPRWSTTTSDRRKACSTPRRTRRKNGWRASPRSGPCQSISSAPR